MRSLVILAALLLTLGQPALAGNLEYRMRVDGLACPYCAYGIEKKLKAIDGVESVEVDLDRGVVRVITREDLRFTEPQLEKLFRDAGFTYRSMEVHAQP